ncbi:head-tail connector protein [Klebsiella variicola subsp. variicola]|nr:head-tail connector protein [Klebsiella variicola subsp. variicola]
MILTLDDVKTQLRLELDFTEHDAMLTQMVNAAQRSIERDYYCKLVTSDEELQTPRRPSADLSRMKISGWLFSFWSAMRI